MYVKADSTRERDYEGLKVSKKGNLKERGGGEYEGGIRGGGGCPTSRGEVQQRNTATCQANLLAAARVGPHTIF